MKKLISMILSAVLLLSLAACGGTPNAADPTPTPTTPSTPEQTPPTEPTAPENKDDDASTDSEGGKVLVVYFSAQNHTEAVAQTIAGHLDADLFELTPTTPYTEEDLNWRDESSRVNDEHEDEALRNIELENVTPDNWENYDVVFVGYPIWWGIAAWPVNNFVKDNDFSGKTVIPFCTSSSSGLGQSGELLAEMAGTGDWQTGQRFQSSVSQSTVVNWVKGLDLPTTPVEQEGKP